MTRVLPLWIFTLALLTGCPQDPAPSPPPPRLQPAPTPPQETPLQAVAEEPGPVDAAPADTVPVEREPVEPEPTREEDFAGLFDAAAGGAQIDEVDANVGTPRVKDPPRVKDSRRVKDSPRAKDPGKRRPSKRKHRRLTPQEKCDIAPKKQKTRDWKPPGRAKSERTPPVDGEGTPGLRYGKDKPDSKNGKLSSRPTKYVARPTRGKWTLIQFYRGSNPQCVKVRQLINSYVTGQFTNRRMDSKTYWEKHGATLKQRGIPNLSRQLVTVSPGSGSAVPEYTNVPQLPQLWLYNASGVLVSKDYQHVLTILGKACVSGQLR